MASEPDHQPRRVSLHIGAHKTATTTIQTLLGAADPLFVLGARYRGSVFDAAYRGKAEGDWAALFLNDFGGDGAAHVRVSEERLMGPPFELGGFYGGLDRLSGLIRGLLQRGIEVAVLLCVRRHFDFLQSWYLQAATSGQAGANILDYALKRRLDCFSWKSVVTAIEAAGVTPQILAYELLHEEPDAFADAINVFFGASLLTGGGLALRKNTSLDAEGLAFIESLAVLRDPGVRKRAARLIRREHSSGERPVLFPPLFEAALGQLLAEADEAFATHYLEGTGKTIWQARRPPSSGAR